MNRIRCTPIWKHQWCSSAILCKIWIEKTARESAEYLKMLGSTTPKKICTPAQWAQAQVNKNIQMVKKIWAWSTKRLLVKCRRIKCSIHRQRWRGISTGHILRSRNGSFTGCNLQSPMWLRSFLLKRNNIRESMQFTCAFRV